MARVPGDREGRRGARTRTPAAAAARTRALTLSLSLPQSPTLTSRPARLTVNAAAATTQRIKAAPAKGTQRIAKPAPSGGGGTKVRMERVRGRRVGFLL